jgi:hypothetical protein
MSLSLHIRQLVAPVERRMCLTLSVVGVISLIGMEIARGGRENYRRVKDNDSWIRHYYIFDTY